MKFLVSLFLAFFMSLGIAQAKVADKKNKAKVIKDTTGVVKWIGYGVGKSHSGTIAVKSGEVTLNGGIPTQAHFVLDMKSLDTADSEKLEGHLKSPDFFEVEKYPEAQLKTTSIEPISFSKVGDPNYQVKGDLTIKDKTQTVEFPMTVSEKAGVYTARIATEIKDRTLYGINYNSKKSSTVSKLGDKLIHDNIKLDIEVNSK